MAIDLIQNPRKCYLVTPSDSTDLPTPGALRIDADGALKVTFIDDTTPVEMLVIAGERIEGIVKRVHATGTSVSRLHCFPISE